MKVVPFAGTYLPNCEAFVHLNQSANKFLLPYLSRWIDEVAKKDLTSALGWKVAPLSITSGGARMGRGQRRTEGGWGRSSPWQMEFVKVEQYRGFARNGGGKYRVNICAARSRKRDLPWGMMSDFLPRYENLISGVLVSRRVEPTAFYRGLFSHMHKISL